MTEPASVRIQRCNNFLVAWFSQQMHSSLISSAFNQAWQVSRRLARGSVFALAALLVLAQAMQANAGAVCHNSAVAVEVCGEADARNSSTHDSGDHEDCRFCTACTPGMRLGFGQPPDLGATQVPVEFADIEFLVHQTKIATQLQQSVVKNRGPPSPETGFNVSTTALQQLVSTTPDYITRPPIPPSASIASRSIAKWFPCKSRRSQWPL